MNVHYLSQFTFLVKSTFLVDVPSNKYIANINNKNQFKLKKLIIMIKNKNSSYLS